LWPSLEIVFRSPNSPSRRHRFLQWHYSDLGWIQSKDYPINTQIFGSDMGTQGSGTYFFLFRVILLKNHKIFIPGVRFGRTTKAGPESSKLGCHEQFTEHLVGMKQIKHLSFRSSNHTLSSSTTTLYAQQLAHYNINPINRSPIYQRTHICSSCQYDHVIGT
jgi:hypothetical protein